MTTVVKMDKEIIMHKMQELCSLLLQDEGYKEMRAMIDQFAADEQATEQYERFMEKIRHSKRKSVRILNCLNRRSNFTKRKNARSMITR